MKLSEAIQLGAMMGPQIFGDFLGGPIFGEGSCALGGAIVAIGKNPYDILPGDIWPELSIVTSCPICPQRLPLDQIIVELNDDHRWTREQIADWVATIEPKEVDVQQSQDERGDGRAGTQEALAQSK